MPPRKAFLTLSVTGYQIGFRRRITIYCPTRKSHAMCEVIDSRQNKAMKANMTEAVFAEIREAASKVRVPLLVIDAEGYCDGVLYHLLLNGKIQNLSFSWIDSDSAALDDLTQFARYVEQSALALVQ